MKKTVSNRQFLADRPNPVHVRRAPFSSCCVARARRNSTFRISHSPFTKCHHLTLREKSVLTQRTHLTLMLDKRKSRRSDHRHGPRTPGARLRRVETPIRRLAMVDRRFSNVDCPLLRQTLSIFDSLADYQSGRYYLHACSPTPSSLRCFVALWLANTATAMAHGYHHWASSNAPMRGTAFTGRDLRMAWARVRSALVVIFRLVASETTTETGWPESSTS